MCVPQQMEPQSHALAQTLNVVLETCREQRELIGMLTQKNNQEKIVKLSEACYCCKGYDQPCLPNKVILSTVCYCCVGYERPCLQSPPTYWTIMHNQSFGDNSQSPLVPPQVAPRKDDQYMMEIPAQGNDVPTMNLRSGDITCTNFRPRRSCLLRCYNCGEQGHLARKCRQPDVSIRSYQPLKYKMATIPTLNLMLPPKGLIIR